MSYLCTLTKIPRYDHRAVFEDSPDTIGMCFAADVLKRNQQLILVLCESVTSYTTACFHENERRETFRDGVLKIAVQLHPLDGPCATIRVDPASGVMALRDDSTQLRNFALHKFEIGSVKNPNKKSRRREGQIRN